MRLARRRPWLAGALAAVVALVVVSGLAGARYVTGWLDGPRSIGVGTEGADALAVSPDGRVLYAANWGEDAGDSSGITVVNLATGRAGQRIDIGGGAVMLAMMPGGRALYAVVEQDDNSARLVSYRLVRVGLATLRTEGEATFRYVEDMVPAPAGSLLYVLAETSKGPMAVVPVDAGSGREGTAIPVPAGSQAMAVSPDGRMLYIGTGSSDGKGPGQVIAVDALSGKAGNPARFSHAVIGLAVSADGRRLFGLASSYKCRANEKCGGRCDLVGIDLMTGAALRQARLDSGCYQVEVAPDQPRLFVLNGKSLTAVNSMTGQVEKTIRTSGHVAGESDDFLIAPDGRTIYVADAFKGVVVIPVP